MKTRLVGAIVLTSLVLSLAAACSSSRPSQRIRTFSLSSSAPATSTKPVSTGVPHFDHIVVVVEENHGFQQIVDAADAPYLNSLRHAGVLMTRSFAITHPSEPNYLALFSGSTHGVTSDACPLSLPGPDLAGALAAKGKTFIGYAEGLPSSGSPVCSAGSYARKHAPWVNFADVPASASQPMSAFPTDFASLPSVAFVVPNLEHDMHDGTVAEASTWLQQHLSRYASWAQTHNSLLMVTFDEDDYGESNQVSTVLVGAQVRRNATDAEHVDHYSVLRTIEDAFGVARVGKSAQRAPITQAWRT